MMKMSTGTTVSDDRECELRPGGLVVQRRTDHSSNIPRFIRVRVKYGSVHHQISINSQSTFGELKKILSVKTGVHHQDMKILYKDKERDSKLFLDLSGVKDRSKLILKDDPVSMEKRLLEMRKIVSKEKATKTISEISFEVDRFARKLSMFETMIRNGGKIEEEKMENLMEMLMNRLVELDAILGDGDNKLKKKIQEERLQKYVEALDVMKIKNSMQPQTQPLKQPEYKESDLITFEEDMLRKRSVSSSCPQVVITTRWQTFDSNSNSMAEEKMVKPFHQKSKWELFN